MPRPPRRISTNGIYHIMIRGINRQTIFEDDQDRRRFIDTIRRYKDVCKIKVYSYCLMDNHIHLLLKETEIPVSKAVQRIGASYVYWYNNKYERSGHLFQGRYKRENVENVRYFLTVLRYIHQNPVKAGLVDSAFDCKWTSINEYLAGTGGTRGQIYCANGTTNLTPRSPSFVDIDFALQLFSSDRKKALQLFSDYMQRSNDDDCLDDHVKRKVSDDEVRAYLKQMGVLNNSALQQMRKQQRNEILLELKKVEGVSLGQLARITGISKSVIFRIR
ncbi:transposase [Radiobacillus sp. PE A8.2]|uniref:transposase n=1 Tax=Radiobacillus sp. PE A8.2 TaxID=3380349 RepID=UPI00388E0200